MDWFYLISSGIILTSVVSFGIVIFSLKYTKYQVEDLKNKLEIKNTLTEDEKILLNITKEYLEKVK
tara:strand:+ start:222 stop:419 length:198 start_codon:yes stop_codon:yes gene_type:complete